MTAAELTCWIEDAEQALAAVARLIESATPLAAWPDDLRAALALALACEGVGLAEGWKAVALRRHLFGPRGAPADLGPPPAAPDARTRRRAERLRADLPALVNHRAGQTLLARSGRVPAR